MFSKENQEKKVYKYYPNRQIINFITLLLVSGLILVGIPLLEHKLQKEIIPKGYRDYETLTNAASFATVVVIILLNTYNPAYEEVECKN